MKQSKIKLFDTTIFLSLCSATLYFWGYFAHVGLQEGYKIVGRTQAGTFQEYLLIGFIQPFRNIGGFFLLITITLLIYGLFWKLTFKKGENRRMTKAEKVAKNLFQKFYIYVLFTVIVFGNGILFYNSEKSNSSKQLDSYNAYYNQGKIPENYTYVSIRASIESSNKNEVLEGFKVTFDDNYLNIITKDGLRTVPRELIKLISDVELEEQPN